MDVSYRFATSSDVSMIVALVESAYRGEASRAGWTTEADLLDGQRIDAQGVAELIARPHSLVLLLDGTPHTTAHAQHPTLACCHVEKQGERCYFGMFAVAPGAQGGGIGARLLDAAERLAREEWKCTKMEMTVITLRDELIAWYARRGYRRSGVFKPFPYGDARFGIPKRDDLRFELLVKSL